MPAFICWKDEALFDLSTVWKSLYGDFSFSHSFAHVPSWFYYFSFKESALTEWIITAIFQLCIYCSVPLIMCLCIFPVRCAEEWKPINPEDKKRYDREFLLGCQFISASMHKPEGLPIISDVVLDKVGDVELCKRTQKRYKLSWRIWQVFIFYPPLICKFWPHIMKRTTIFEALQPVVQLPIFVTWCVVPGRHSFVKGWRGIVVTTQSERVGGCKCDNEAM